MKTTGFAWLRAVLGGILLVTALLPAGNANYTKIAAWITAGWGIGLAFSAWHTFGERPISQADIDAEMGRLHRA